MFEWDDTGWEELHSRDSGDPIHLILCWKSCHHLCPNPRFMRASRNRQDLNSIGMIYGSKYDIVPLVDMDL